MRRMSRPAIATDLAANMVQLNPARERGDDDDQITIVDIFARQIHAHRGGAHPL